MGIEDIDVAPSWRVQAIDVTPSPAGGCWQVWNVFIEHNRGFMLDRISVLGLASNLLSGTLRIDDAARGRRLFDDMPLAWWGVRGRRRLPIPWFFLPGSTLQLIVGWKGEIKAAHDLLGRPREFQRLHFVFEGRDVYTVKPLHF